MYYVVYVFEMAGMVSLSRSSRTSKGLILTRLFREAAHLSTPQSSNT